MTNGPTYINAEEHEQARRRILRCTGEETPMTIDYGQRCAEMLEYLLSRDMISDKVIPSEDQNLVHSELWGCHRTTDAVKRLLNRKKIAEGKD